VVVTHPTDPNVRDERWIPKGSSTNGIASGWNYAGAAVRLNPNADIDAIIFENPNTYENPPGDGIKNFDEYRGILYIPAGSSTLEHERLNPYRKDLFLRADGFDDAFGDPYDEPAPDAEYPFRLGLALQIAGVDVHNTTGWGHDASADNSFYIYYRNGNITDIDSTTYLVTGAEAAWSNNWPRYEWEFKLDGDPSDAWTPIYSWIDDGAFYLDRPYTGGANGPYAIRMPLPPLNVLIVKLDKEKFGVFTAENDRQGHIYFMGASPPNPENIDGSRFWTWSTTGLGIYAKNFYGLASVLQLPLDRYFGDRPYQKSSIWDPQQGWITEDVWEPALMKLMPLRMCEDFTDERKYIDGWYDETIGTLLGNKANGLWDGDRRLPAYDEWAQIGHLNPFDVDNNGFVELPLASNPDADNSSKQFAVYDENLGTWIHPYTKAWVLMHTITHEVCHVLAGSLHSQVPKDLMYKYSNNWKREDYLSDWYRSMLYIHNQQR